MSDFKDSVNRYGSMLVHSMNELVKQKNKLAEQEETYLQAEQQIKQREKLLSAKEKAYRIAVQRVEQRNKDLLRVNQLLKKSLSEALTEKPVNIIPEANIQGDITVKVEEMLSVMHRVDKYLAKLSRNADLEYDMLQALRVALDQP